MTTLPTAHPVPCLPHGPLCDGNTASRLQEGQDPITLALGSLTKVTSVGKSFLHPPPFLLGTPGPDLVPASAWMIRKQHLPSSWFKRRPVCASHHYTESWAWLGLARGARGRCQCHPAVVPGSKRLLQALSPSQVAPPPSSPASDACPLLASVVQWVVPWPYLYNGVGPTASGFARMDSSPAEKHLPST